MNEVKTVLKTADVAVNAYNSYEAVEHDEVTRILHDPIVNNGIAVNPSMEICETSRVEVFDKNGNKKISNYCLVKVSLTFINIDKPDERLVSYSYAEAFDNGDKGIGKAYSMATKYCYLKTFMLESLDKEEERNFNLSKDKPKEIKQEKQQENKPAQKPNSIAEAAKYIRKTGQNKGKPLSDFTLDDLESFLAWARKADVKGAAWEDAAAVESYLEILKKDMK